ncbi:MAG: hypothetical protein WAK17_15045 [Candidatus Nitrosopolaris sp.]
MKIAQSYEITTVLPKNGVDAKNSGPIIWMLLSKPNLILGNQKAFFINVLQSFIMCYDFGKFSCESEIVQSPFVPIPDHKYSRNPVK